MTKLIELFSNIKTIRLLLVEKENLGIRNCLIGNLKTADIVPVYKAKNPFYKTSYEPFIFLPLLSKVFERLIFDQLSNYANNLQTKFDVVFGRSIVHSLLFLDYSNPGKKIGSCRYGGPILMGL